MSQADAEKASPWSSPFSILTKNARLVFPPKRELPRQCHDSTLVPNRLGSCHQGRSCLARGAPQCPHQEQSSVERRISVVSRVPTSIASQATVPTRPPLAVVNGMMTRPVSSAYSTVPDSAPSNLDNHPDIRAVTGRVPQASSSYDDDRVSITTASTLPPSYRTRRSVIDLDERPVPPLPALYGPRPPPSAFTHGATISQRPVSEATHRSSADGMIGVADLVSRQAGAEACNAPKPRHSQRRRSQDGGIRLEGGSYGDLQELTRSATRPPPYKA